MTFECTENFSTVQIFCTRLTQQVIPPKGNITLVIFFLPVSLGYVEGSLLVKTNLGSYLYHVVLNRDYQLMLLQVRGRGIPNAFELKPLMGLKIPVHMTYTRSIEIFNPFPASVSVEEAHVSGSFMRLSQSGSGSGEPYRPTVCFLLYLFHA